MSNILASILLERNNPKKRTYHQWEPIIPKPLLLPNNLSSATLQELEALACLDPTPRDLETESYQLFNKLSAVLRDPDLLAEDPPFLPEEEAEAAGVVEGTLPSASPLPRRSSLLPPLEATSANWDTSHPPSKAVAMKLMPSSTLWAHTSVPILGVSTVPYTGYGCILTCHTGTGMPVPVFVQWL
jgi:hypothetical protein